MTFENFSTEDKARYELFNSSQEELNSSDAFDTIDDKGIIKDAYEKESDFIRES